MRVIIGPRMRDQTRKRRQFRTGRSPGASSPGSGVASGALCPAPAAGTTFRRNRRRPQAWHPGPSGNPAGRRSELEESELRAEGGAVAGKSGRGRERGETLVGKTDSRRRGGGSISTPYVQSRATPCFISHPRPRVSCLPCLAAFIQFITFRPFQFTVVRSNFPG